MKRILILPFALFLLASGALGQEAGGGGPGRSEPGLPNFKVNLPQWWGRYTVKDEELSVTLPALPELTTKTTFQARLQKSRLEHLLSLRIGLVRYLVIVFENPEPRQSLAEFIAERTAKSIVDLSTERNITVNGFAGKEYTSTKHILPFTIQFVATEKRLYTFSVLGLRTEDAQTQQFFSSITLDHNADGIEVPDGPAYPSEVKGEKVFRVKDVQVRARVTKKPEPSYTSKAEEERIFGAVFLKVVFSANGQIENIQVIAGLPYGLTEQAIKAAKKIKFVPAMKDGKPVAVWMHLEYNFTL